MLLSGGTQSGHASDAILDVIVSWVSHIMQMRQVFEFLLWRVPHLWRPGCQLGKPSLIFHRLFCFSYTLRRRNTSRSKLCHVKLWHGLSMPVLVGSWECSTDKRVASSWRLRLEAQVDFVPGYLRVCKRYAQRNDRKSLNWLKLHWNMSPRNSIICSFKTFPSAAD